MADGPHICECSACFACLLTYHGCYLIYVQLKSVTSILTEYHDSLNLALASSQSNTGNPNHYDCKAVPIQVQRSPYLRGFLGCHTASTASCAVSMRL